MTDQLLDLRESPLSVDECLAAVRRPSAGGVVVFTGLVRDHDHGRAVTELEYSVHPGAAEELARVADRVCAAHDVTALAAVHRVGVLSVGEVAVVVAVSAAHRDTAFAAARALIDDLKATVPIWKRQRFADGDVEWVGCA